MKKEYLKRIVAILMAFTVVMVMCLAAPISSYAAEPNFKLKGNAAILVDARTGEVLYEKNADKKYRPASMTKMMTAILVCENIEDMSEKTKVSKYVTTIGGSAIGLKKNEEISIDALLHAMLVYSANDCAVALAEAVSGSVEEFAKLMNSKAEELGCTHTHFVNPNGLDDDGHVSTARDMAIIARKAMEYDVIRDTVKMTTYQIPKTNKRKSVTVGTTDRLLWDTYNWINVNGESRHPYYKYAVGIKTGYTDLAGGCLACKAVKGNEEYISVVMHSTAFDRFADSIEIMEWAFDNFDRVTVVKKGDEKGEAEVKGGKESTVSAVAKKKLSICVENGDEGYDENIEWNDVEAPVKQGDVVGKLIITQGDTEKGTVELVAASDVEESIIAKIMKNEILLIGIGAALLLLVVLLIIRKRRK